MKLKVERKDNRGNIIKLNIEMPWLAFIKHMAISGQGFIPSIRKFKRMLGKFFIYSDYLRYSSYQNSSFSKPPIFLYDPTSTAQFSNIAGKSIADFLGKRLDGAIISFNYDAALKMLGFKVQSRRPDLLCANSLDIFSIEAKGLSKISVSNNEMAAYKQQAQSGPIPVKFSIASVAYNLYNQVKVKYHDPKNDDFLYNKELVKKLSIQYYRGIKSFINEDIFEIKRKSINKNNYYNLIFPLKRLYEFNRFFPFSFDRFNRISILIDIRISDFIKYGIMDSKTEQYFSNENIYIDSDGIGLMLL